MNDENVFYYDGSGKVEDKTISKVVIATSATKIRYKAFEYCTKLQSVVFEEPHQVTEIVEWAFEHCYALESIELPKSLLKIGERAFRGCHSLQRIVIPGRVTSIGCGAFKDCHALQSIELPESLLEIDHSAFGGCSSLQRIVIPGRVTSIGYSAFENCHVLKSIELPESLLTIAARAFDRCYSVQRIVIPERVTLISGRSFQDCQALESIELPESLLEIGERAFNHCHSLERIVIPGRVTSIGHSTFEDCQALQSIELPESLLEIDHSGFGGCRSLQRIVIPGRVTSIGYSAFEDCHALESIELPKSLLTIGERAFRGCHSLQRIVIPGRVTSIAYRAFTDCRALESIELPESLLKIGARAFRQCHSLQRIVIPGRVTSIGHSAFEHCRALESIELPESLLEIDHRTFRGCHSLRRIVIPGRVTLIDELAFAESGIEEIALSDGVESIEEWTFHRCPRLNTLRLPASLKEIQWGVIKGCEKLDNVIFPAEGFPLLKSLEIDSSRGWEAMFNKIAQKAPNLTIVLVQSVVREPDGRSLDNGDIPLVIEMVSSCPHLESLELSCNAFSDQVIRTLDSEGILGRLRNVDLRHNYGTENMLSAKEFLNLLQKNPRLAIWTDHKWEASEDELIRHYLDMNRFGCHGVPITNVSIWPQLIDRLERMKFNKLKTRPANVLYHLLLEQNNYLCLYYPQNRTKWHPDCEKRIAKLKMSRDQKIKTENNRLPLLLDQHDISADKDNEEERVKRRRRL